MLGKDEQNIFLFLMDAGLLISVKYTRHFQTDNIRILMYKPFIWEIIFSETLN
jgi:hypothetical protein